MAWSVPRVWTVGEIVSAANMNTYISDNLTYLKSSAITLNAASSATPNGTITAFPIGESVAATYVEVFVNGLKRNASTDYAHVPGENHVDFVWTPAAGDIIRFNYIPA